METEVPAVGDQYNYPPDTWHTHNRNNSTASNISRRSTRAGSGDATSNRHVQVFQTGNEEKPTGGGGGHGLYRSQSSSTAFSSVSSSSRKQLPGQPSSDNNVSGSERARSNTLPMTQDPPGQTVPLGLGNNVYVSRYASKNSIDGDHAGWK